MLEKLRTLLKNKALDRPKITTPSATTLAPVVVIACGAGMAFWWWSQWARSREDARQAEAAATPVDGEVTDIVGPEAADALVQSLAVQAEDDRADSPSASVA